MQKKFECWNCHKTFNADDSSWVECPHCHSDNVEYASWHAPKCLKYYTPAAVAVGLVAGCAWYYWPETEVKQEVKEYDANNAQEAFAAKADSVFIENGGTIAPSISIAENEYDEATNTYKCRFQVDYPPVTEDGNAIPWKLVVYTYRGEKKVAESEDGVFENLPFSEFDGFYIVKLLNKETEELLTDEKEFPDFAKQVNIKKPWTAAELQAKLNGKENLTDNDYLADHHEVVVINKPKGDMTPTSSLREVQQLLKNCQLKATVKEVKYDDMNKIVLAKITINYPKDWMKVEEDEDY